MNKFFTLIATALMATTAAFAQDTKVLDLSAFAENGGHAGASVTANADGSYAFQCPDGWGWFSAWYGVAGDDGVTTSGLDLSDYNYLVLELSEAAAFSVQGNVQYLDESANNNASLASGGTILNIPLAEGAKANVTAVALQNGAAGTFNVKAVYAAKEKQVAATQEIQLSSFGGLTDNGDGTYTVPGGWAWNNIWLGAADWSDYAYMVVEVPEAPAEAAKIQIQYNNGIDDTEAFYAEGNNICAALDPVGKASVTQVALQAASDFKVTRAYLTNTKPGETAINGVSAVETAKTGRTFNLAGQLVGKDFKGVVIRDGKKFVQK